MIARHPCLPWISVARISLCRLKLLLQMSLYWRLKISSVKVQSANEELKSGSENSRIEIGRAQDSIVISIRVRAESCEGRLAPGLALCSGCSNPESQNLNAQRQIMDVELDKLDIRSAPQ